MQRLQSTLHGGTLCGGQGDGEYWWAMSWHTNAGHPCSPTPGGPNYPIAGWPLYKRRMSTPLAALPPSCQQLKSKTMKQAPLSPTDASLGFWRCEPCLSPLNLSQHVLALRPLRIPLRIRFSYEEGRSVRPLRCGCRPPHAAQKAPWLAGLCTARQEGYCRLCWYVKSVTNKLQGQPGTWLHGRRGCIRDGPNVCTQVNPLTCA